MSATVILYPARNSAFVRYCVGTLADLPFPSRARKFVNLLWKHTDYLKAIGFDPVVVEAYATELTDEFWGYFPADRRSA